MPRLLAGKSKRAAAKLAKYFARSGYTRAKNTITHAVKGLAYHKGYEVRIIAQSDDELDEMLGLAREAGLRHGKPYSKHSRTVLPFYGKEAMEVLIGLVSARESEKA